MLDSRLKSTTTLRLLKKTIRHPLRAVNGVLQAARFARLSERQERDAAVAFLSNAFETDVRSILDKHQRSGFGGWMERRRAQLNDFPGPYRLGATPPFDCDTIYLLVRSLKPDVVVETGVCYGASSAYILQALAENRRGVLYSIDLGNTPNEPPNDFFVPQYLRDRWHLIIGDCKQQLPPLLARLGRIDLFHHDSLHTYEHMMWEYSAAFPYLPANGVLSSHDVRTIVNLARPFQRNPFSAFCEQYGLRSVVSFNVGIAMRSDAVARQDEPSEEYVRSDADMTNRRRAAH
jgi:predicted O-methyltransferase YrrM